MEFLGQTIQVSYNSYKTFKNLPERFSALFIYSFYAVRATFQSSPNVFSELKLEFLPVSGHELAF